MLVANKLRLHYKTVTMIMMERRASACKIRAGSENSGVRIRDLLFGRMVFVFLNAQH